MILFILYLFVYSFFKHFEDEGKKWIVGVVCEETNNFKNQEKLIF